MDPTRMDTADLRSALAELPRPAHLRALFADDPGRAERYVVEVGDLRIDYSKHRIDDAVLAGLVALAERSGVEARRDAMFAGEHVNVTEDRAVMHVALRAPSDSVITVDGANVVPDVHEVLDAMSAFADRVRADDRITHVVNIGIGGSDLGPAMAYRALDAYRHERIRCSFVSNVDGADIASVLAGSDPASTLFVVASKTFGTIETLTNARTARSWLVDALGEAAVADHFVAVSTNAERVAEFGIDTANMFGFWDWVGGRYSVDSAIGLSLMIAIGPERFREFLHGFHLVDEHFRTAPLAANAPGADGAARGLVRQRARLRHQGGAAVRRGAGPIPGVSPTARHGVQRQVGAPRRHAGGRRDGSDRVGRAGHQRPARLLPVAPSGHPSRAGRLHRLRHAAPPVPRASRPADGQSVRPVRGAGVRARRPAGEPYRQFDGDRPNTVILAEQLTPSVLGQLIALYEHVVHVQGTIWGVNSYDQWGVELGKELANRITPELVGEPTPSAHDASTNALIAWYRARR